MFCQSERNDFPFYSVTHVVLLAIVAEAGSIGLMGIVLKKPGTSSDPNQLHHAAQMYALLGKSACTEKEKYFLDNLKLIE